MEEKYEEVLERIWTLEEGNLSERVPLLDLSREFPNGDLLVVLEKNELIKRRSDCVELTAEGRRMAEVLIRNHRLAERLLHELFQIEDPELEVSACKFEHILSPTVTDSVCTFLGHPPVCPHGRRIPPGNCCKEGTKKLKPLVSSLLDFDPGREVKIVFITPEVQKRLTRLSSLGILPGAHIKIVQKRPSVVLRVDETTIAIETEVARGIYGKED